MAGETTTSSLSVDQVAFDRLAYFALRSELLFDQAADVQPVAQAMPGTGVTFTIFADIAAATSTLNEVTDVTPTALSDSQVTVTLAEYGNAVVTTAKLRGTAFLDVDSAAANIIGYNAGDSMDQVVRDVLAGGTNVVYATGGSTTPTSRESFASWIYMPGSVCVDPAVGQRFADVRFDDRAHIRRCHAFIQMLCRQNDGCHTHRYAVFIAHRQL